MSPLPLPRPPLGRWNRIKEEEKDKKDEIASWIQDTIVETIMLPHEVVLQRFVETR